MKEPEANEHWMWFEKFSIMSKENVFDNIIKIIDVEGNSICYYYVYHLDEEATFEEISRASLYIQRELFHKIFKYLSAKALETILNEKIIKDIIE
jgi:hypothetical protein